MDRRILVALVAFVVVAAGGLGVLVLTAEQGIQLSYTAQEKGFAETSTFRSLVSQGGSARYSLTELENWRRSPGPLRVGIQAGHWKVDEVPDELAELKLDGAGAEGGGVREAAVVYAIASRVKEILEAKGVTTDLLPATVPPGYAADAFVAIHADSNDDETVSGRKITIPRLDYSGTSIFLQEFLRDEYKRATSIDSDTNVTRSVSRYYAFDWYTYEHAIHPMTPAAIIVLGFLTNQSDRAIIVEKPDFAAQAIADGILRFLNSRASK